MEYLTSLKQNWCINTQTLLEFELLTLSNWFLAKYKIKITDDYVGFIAGKPVSDNLMYSQVPLITFEAFHKSILKTENDYEKIHNSLFCYREELVKLEEKLTKVINDKLDVLSFVKQNENIEERLTKLIEQKLGNTTQPQSNPTIGKNTIFKPEEPKPIWKTHPDWESCKTERNRHYRNLIGGVCEVFGDYTASTSEAHAKRQLAEIKLMEIAEKWNEGVEIENNYVYFPYPSNNNLYVATMIPDTITFTLCPFFFNSKTLAQKSIELHKKLWEQYFTM